MNARAVRWLLGALCLLLSAAQLVPALVSLLYGEGSTARGMFLAAACTALLGLGLVAISRGALALHEGRAAFFRREAIAVVALGWIVAGVVGALPYVLCEPHASAIDGFFEATSGFTTTGGTIFSPEQIDALPMGVHAWRGLTHWIGGIGIVLVFVAVMPSGGRSLFLTEGITRESSRARARDAAIALLRVYVVLTVVHAALLYFAGMTVFDSIFHAFSSMSTGGFSTHGDSLAYFRSAWVEVICIVFMAGAGMNFEHWDRLWRHGPREAFAAAARSSELRAYFGLMLACSAILTFVLWFWGGPDGANAPDAPYNGFLACVRDATFNLVSVETATGYMTSDFDQWPGAGRVILMVAAMLGACGGSTGGGFKIFRVVLLWRGAAAAVRSFARPRAVTSVRMDQHGVHADVLNATLRYLAVYFLGSLAGLVALSLLGMGPTAALTGMIACMNNMGPGLGPIGPAASYGELSAACKAVLSGLMILGRLEFYPVLAILLPGFWRR